MADQLQVVEVTIPHEVVSATVEGSTPVRAWRQYLKLTQDEVAVHLGISLAIYAEHEPCESPERPFLDRVAVGLGLTLEQLDF